MNLCPECHQPKLICFGWVWKKDPEAPSKRIKVRRYQCKSCGRTTTRPEQAEK